MSGCSIYDDYNHEEFLEHLSNFGKCIDFTSQPDVRATKKPIFLGKICRILKHIKKGEEGNRPYDTLVFFAKCLISADSKEFRIFMCGDVVETFLEGGIKKDYVIAVLNPKFYYALHVPSLVIGPQDTLSWICKKYHMVPSTRRDRSKQVKDLLISTNDDGPDFNIGSDDTDADPDYIPDAVPDLSERRRESAEDSQASDVMNSTFSLSLHGNHETYRSKPVDLKQINSLSKSGRMRIMERSSTPVLSMRKGKSTFDQNACRENENIKSLQEQTNNLFSQNTAVAGSSQLSNENIISHDFPVPVSTKTFKKSNILDRTRCTTKTGCTKDSNAKSCCQSRQICSSNHCSYQHCNSNRQECSWTSCHCQPCGSHRFCCPPVSCSHECRPERDVSCRMPSDVGCSCRTHVERVHAYPHGGPKSHCSRSCRGLEHPCCSQDYRPRSCCDSSYLRISSVCCNHCYRGPSHAHEHMLNNALKSLEQLREQQLNHLNDKGQMSFPPVETSKRIQKWVQEWTPSLPLSSESSIPSPQHKSIKSHSIQNLHPPRSRRARSFSNSSSGESDLRREQIRKKRRVVDKDLNSNESCLKALAPNSSESMVISTEQTEQIGNRDNVLHQPLVEHFKNKDQIKKRKLFNIKDNVSFISDKCVAASRQIVEESTPFSSEQTVISENVNSRSLLPSSSGLEKRRETQSTDSITLPEKNVVHKECDSNQKGKISNDRVNSSSVCASSEAIPKVTGENIDKEGDELSKVVEMKEISNKISDTISASAMDIDDTLVVNLNGNNGVTQNNENSMYLEETLNSENCHEMENSKLSQSQKYTEGTFPELKIDSISVVNYSPDYTPAADNIQETVTHVSDVLSCKNSNDIAEEEERPNNSNGNSPNKKTDDKSSHNIQKSLSLSGYSKIKGNTSGNLENCNEEEALLDDKKAESFGEDVEQMELVCKPKVRKSKRKARRGAGSVSGSDSGKSNETIDLENVPTIACKEIAESVVSSPGTFYDAQSNCSEKSKTSSAEKWCMKTLHELNLSPKINEALQNISPRISKQMSYDLRLFHEFKVSGMIIDTEPKVLDQPFAIVKGFCNEGCRKAYTHSEYINMEEFIPSCSFCSYRSHWLCPGCSKQGKHEPLCMYYEFELHVFDGENVLRIEVDNKEAVTFIGCTPPIYLKNTSKAVDKFQKAIFIDNPNFKPVSLLQFSIKTVKKSGLTILSLHQTSLKKNLVVK